jgi:hypothetical protein
MRRITLSLILHRIEKNLISQIERSKGEVNRLGNMLRSEMLMKEAQQIALVVQKVGYSYNVEERRIVDPLGLSVTIKAQNMEEGVLS